jgi:elongation factor P
MMTSDFKKGLPIKYDGNTFILIGYTFVNPGKGTAFTRAKIKNIKTGKTMEVTFKSGENIEAADVQYKRCNYMYFDGTDYNFIDNSNYEQYGVSAELIGDQKDYMMENGEVTLVFVDNAAISVQLPPKMEFKVIDAPPGNKGDTATGGTKQVTIETGAKVNAPLFIKEGDVLRVNTDTGEYVERVAK